MTTYRATKPKKITRDEGNSADVILKVPDILPMEGRTIQFLVKDSSDNIILNKTTENGITINGQIVSIQLYESDLVGFSGTHRWKAKAIGFGSITVGFGPFIIVKD